MKELIYKFTLANGYTSPVPIKDLLSTCFVSYVHTISYLKYKALEENHTIY